MSNNKIVCVHITKNNIRLLEGRVNSGVMLITRSAIVQKAGRFFHNGRLAFMSEMVTAIINTMNINSFTANQLHIVYDNGLEVEFFLDEKLHVKNSDKKFNLNFGKKGKTEDGATAASGGVISHKKSWGRYITEAEQGELYTTTKIERDLVNFMIAEFQEHGYKVESIEAPETTLLYLRKFIPYSYDALNKLVVYSNDRSQGTFYQFTKDSPAGTKTFHFESAVADSFKEMCVGAVKEEIKKSGLHNPHIMLVGDAFSDPDEYIDICDTFKEDGIFVIDIYGLWQDRGAPLNMVRVVTPSQGIDIDIDGQFGICVALLARSMENKPENMVEGFHPMFIGKSAKRALSSGVKTAAMLFLIYNAVFAGIGGYETFVAEQEYQRASDTTDAQLSIAKTARDAVKTKVDNLSTIDRRYNEIFKFVYQQVSDNLNIASVDTMDMIPLPEGSTSVYADPNATPAPPVDPNAAPTPPVPADPNAPPADATPVPTGPVDVTGTSDASEYVMQTIVVRGYSRTSDGPVELYNALVGEGMGEVKVVGVEQVQLPSKETIFAFELTIGTNEGG